MHISFKIHLLRYKFCMENVYRKLGKYSYNVIYFTKNNIHFTNLDKNNIKILLIYQEAWGLSDRINLPA